MPIVSEESARQIQGQIQEESKGLNEEIKWQYFETDRSKVYADLLKEVKQLAGEKDTAGVVTTLAQVLSRAASDVGMVDKSIGSQVDKLASQFAKNARTGKYK